MINVKPFEGLESEVMQEKRKTSVYEDKPIDIDKVIHNKEEANIAKELHEISKTLKEIHREMRKRK